MQLQAVAQQGDRGRVAVDRGQQPQLLAAPGDAFPEADALGQRPTLGQQRGRALRLALVAGHRAQADQRPRGPFHVAELTEHGQRGAGLRVSPVEVALQPGDEGQVAVRAGHRPPVPGGLRHGQALRVQLHRPGVPALLPGHAAQHLQRAGDTPRVVQLPVQPQRGLQPPHGRRVVALQQGQPAAAQQRLGPQPSGRVRIGGHRDVHPLPDLVIATAQVRVPVQRARDPQRRPRIARLGGGLERLAQVGQLGVQPVELELQAVAPCLVALDATSGRLDQLGEVRQMGLPHRVGFARLGQPVPRVIPDRHQQVVPRVAAGVLHPHQRLVRQPGQQLQH